MSSPLPNTLLVQKLDTLLGVSLAKYTSIARSDASFDALLAPGKTTPVEGHTPQRKPPEKTDEAVQDGRRLRQNRAADISSGADRPRPAHQVDSYPSSPTTLGPTARLVLNLLQSYPLTPALLLRHSLCDAKVLAQLSSPPFNSSSAARATPTGSTSAGTTPVPVTARGAVPSTPSQFTAQPTQLASPLSAAASATSASRPKASQPAIGQLASTLARLVQTSGMFYESNLARVAFEGASSQRLQLHPQALIHASAHTTSHSATAASTHPLPPKGPEHMDTAPTASPLPSSNSLTTDQALLVRQQLEVLATQQWQAQTQAWPSVPVLWTIERMPTELPTSEHEPHGDRHPPEEEGQALWQTRLTLQLPQIGTVEACLQFKGDHCQLSLYSPQSADILRQHAPALQAQFAGSSVSLSSMNIFDHRATLPLQAASPEDEQQP